MDSFMRIGIILLVIGFILVGVEMTIPGFGAPGISGIVCLIGGILLTAKTLEEGLTITVVVIVVLAIMLTLVLTVFKRVKAPFILEEDLGGKHDFLNESDLEYLVGKRGTAITDLRPVGKCRIDDIEFDVRAENGYIKKGSQVRISRIHENTIMIKEI